MVILFFKRKELTTESTDVIEDIEDDVIEDIKDEQNEEEEAIGNITKDIVDDTILTNAVIEKIKTGGLTESEIKELDDKLRAKGLSLEEEIGKILKNVEKI